MPGACWKPGGTTPRRPPRLSREAKEPLASPAFSPSSFRPRIASRNRIARLSHGRLHRPPPAVHDPDPARHHAGFVRGGAVRARRAGRAGDRAAVRRRHRRRLAHPGLRAGRRFRRARPGAGRLADRHHDLEVPRRAGPRSGLHQEARGAVRLRQAGARALPADAVELPARSISARAISATPA